MLRVVLLVSFFMAACSNSESTDESTMASVKEEQYTVPTPYPGPNASLFDEINSLRRARNLPALAQNDALTCAAQKHAWDIGPRNACSNKGSDGSTFIERVRACQGVATSELVACNYPDARSAIVGWLQRMDASRILLHPNQVQMGVGEVDKHYVVVFLGM